METLRSIPNLLMTGSASDSKFKGNIPSHTLNGLLRITAVGSGMLPIMEFVFKIIRSCTKLSQIL
jgi:hypothetical protein